MYTIGIDLGGTNIAAGVVNEQYQLVGKASVKTALPRPAEDVADAIKEAALLALSDAGLTLDDMENIDSVGIGTPGAVNNDGVVEFSGNLGFVNVPLRDMVEEHIGKKTYIANDANAAALGEALAGCGNGVKDFIAVTLGTGVGGGIIVGGKLLTGVNGAAGEVGHMILQMGGEHCQCGSDGCFEQYASATALIRQTKDALIRDFGKKSAMWDLIDGALENVDGKTSYQAARAGDELALKVVDQFTEYLAVGVANLINIFQPEVLCIGGGISKEGDYLIKPLTEKVNTMRFAKTAKQQTRIVPATLGNDAGIIGAALLNTQN